MKTKIAEILLDTEAVFLSIDKPFTWASGIKSPIYCDNRKILAFPKERDMIKQGLIDLLNTYEYDAIMGTATAGIPMASMLADSLKKPLGYVRSSKKEHGRGNQIEGFSQSGSRVIVIEDLISTGKSVLQVVEALKLANIEVVAVVAIFSYDLASAIENFKQSNVPFVTLSDFNALATLAVEQGKIEPNQMAKLKQFQKNPKDSSWQD